LNAHTLAFYASQIMSSTSIDAAAQHNSGKIIALIALEIGGNRTHVSCCRLTWTV
jgi:hypothetical protein